VFEIYCSIDDDYGSRAVPTGQGFATEAAAQAAAARLAASQWSPPATFYVQWVPSDDAWIAS
jgi:hypothetical protein